MKNGATMAYRRFKQKIKEYRSRSGMSQSELAMAIGVAPPVISQYEKGSRRPSKIILIQLRESLALEDDEFIELVYLASGTPYYGKAV